MTELLLFEFLQQFWVISIDNEPFKIWKLWSSPILEQFFIDLCEWLSKAHRQNKCYGWVLWMNTKVFLPSGVIWAHLHRLHLCFHTQQSLHLRGSVALVYFRREWPSSHSLTFPNALHVLIMIWWKGQRIPACLAAEAHQLPAIYSGHYRCLCCCCSQLQPEENRHWFTAMFACEDNV